MYKKNIAVVGFGIGHFIDVTTGATVIAGVPTCTRTLNGVGGACANAAAYNAAGAVWEIDLDAADMNGDDIILSFALVGCFPISHTLHTTTVSHVDIAADLAAIIVLLTAIPVTAFPAPTINLATIKLLLRIESTDLTYDALLTVLIPIIEDLVVKYCGLSTITDLDIGGVFPLAGLCKYAMENPIGAKSQTVGSDKTEYGEFPNALLKLLDNFKPDTTGGYHDAHSINLTDINTDLGK